MAYKVISPFADIQDKTKDSPDGRVYAIGDSFPSHKRKVSDERIAKLMSTRNSIGIAVIKKVGE